MDRNTRTNIMLAALVVVLLISVALVGWWVSPSARVATQYQTYAPPEGMGRLGQHFLSSLVGGLVGVFLSHKMRAFRAWAFLAVVALSVLFGVIANVLIGNVVIFLLSACVAFYLLRETLQTYAQRKKKPTTYGSAEWATLEHLQENKLIGKKGFSLGVFETITKEQKEHHPLHYKGDRHLLTVAPTRSGKGVSSIIPNLLTYQGSAVVIDPKGENAMITAARRNKGLKQTVHVIDPWGITDLPSSRFNPLDWLDPADPDINENAMILADSIITPRPGSQDSFWDDEAKALLMGILLWVALEESEQDTRTLGRVREIISLGGMELNDILGEMGVASENGKNRTLSYTW